MDHIQHLFLVIYHSFLDTLKEINPKFKAVCEILKQFDNLEPKKVMDKFSKTINPYLGNIKKKDEDMFRLNIVITEINLRKLWKHVKTHEQKEKVWAFLSLLHETSTKKNFLEVMTLITTTEQYKLIRDSVEKSLQRKCFFNSYK